MATRAEKMRMVKDFMLTEATGGKDVWALCSAPKDKRLKSY
jgi:hypothetical protein